MYRSIRIMRFFLISCLVFGTASLCFADFQDPDFDNGVNDWAAEGYPFEATTEFVHSGTYAAKNQIITVTDEDYYGQIYQIITPYATGEPVYMSAWMLTNLAVGSSARAGIMVEFLDAADQPIPDTAIKTEMGGANYWFEIYVTGHAPAGTAKLRAGAFIYAKQGDISALLGTAYVDDCYIAKTEAPGGIITNPGFESQLSGWTPVSFIATSAEQHSGTYSVVDTIPDATGHWGFIYQDEYPFSAGTDIYASAWGKSDIGELSTAKGGLIVQFLNGSNGLISEIKSQIGGRTDWRQLYVAGTAPGTTAKVRIGGFIWAGTGDTEAVDGKFYIDDFVVSTDYIVPPPPQTDIINGDFENGVNDWDPDPALGQGVPFYATDLFVHSGSIAVENTIGDTTPREHWGEIYQEISYEPGRAAFVTAWVKTEIDPLSSAVGGIDLQFYDAAGQPTGTRAYSQIGAIRDWTLLYVNKIAPPDAATLKIGGFVWAARYDSLAVNGKVYLDDIELSDTPPSDLILNPGFENALSVWVQDELNFNLIEVTDEDQHTGTYSAKATIEDTSTAGEDYWSRVYQEFDFGESEEIYATLWAKTDINPSSTAAAGLLVEFLDEFGEPISISDLQQNIGGQTGWTYLYVNGFSPSGTEKVRVSCFAYCPEADSYLGGVAYFDDVVASLDALPLPEFPIALDNVDFEGGLNNWQDLYGPPSELDSLDPHAGFYSAKKTIVEIPDEDYFSIIYQDIYYDINGALFPIDQDVYLTAYLKSNINVASSAKAGIRIEYFNAANEAVEIGKDEISAVNDWRQLYIAATIPAGARKVRVSGFAWAPEGETATIGGTVNFDDFVYSYSFITPPPRQTELLNLDFEGGLDNWQDLYGPPSELDNIDFHGGLYSAKKTIVEITDEDYFSTIYQDIYYDSAGTLFPVDQDVYLTAYVKSSINVAASATVGVRLESFDAAGIATEISHDQISAVNNWRQLYVTGTIPAGTTKVRVSGFGFAPEGDAAAIGGTVNFDDFLYSGVPIPHPSLPTQLLNVGFENGLNDWKNFYRPVFLSVDPVHLGTYAAKFIIDDVVTGSYYGEIRQDIAVRAGKIVIGKVWAKTDINPAATSKAQLELRFLDSGGGFVSMKKSNFIGGIKDWELLSVSATAPFRTASVSFRCTIYSPQDTVGLPEAEGGTAYFDDAYLRIKACLLKGTNITLADGSLKPIELIKVGDMVMGVDKEGELVASEVSETFAHSDEPGFCIIETEDNKVLKTTDNHPVRNCNKYVEAGSLKPGDAITILDNKKLTQTKITRIIVDTSVVDVYNLEVSGTHNYFAEGCLVHNKPKPILKSAMPYPGEPPTW